MSWIPLAAAVLVATLVVDRVALAAERRGWIYYRHRKASSGSLSSAAFGPVAEVFQPGSRIVAEEQFRRRTVRRAEPGGQGR